MSAYDELSLELSDVSDVLNALNLLNWDARTQMPSGGAGSRGQQIATLSAIAQQRLASDRLLTLLDGCETELEGLPENGVERRSVAAARQASAFYRRLSPSLTREFAALKTVAQGRWAEARAANDFALFAPDLERVVAFSRELAETIGYADHPYDAMVGLYEPGMTAQRLEGLFAELRQGLLPLLRRITDSGVTPADDFLHLEYPVDSQRAFALEVAQAFGYDLTRGRLDASLHPFEISLTRDDVRITTRYDQHFLSQALFGLLHETGHALYEQGVDPSLARGALTSDLMNLYAVAGTSFGAHESQSRLWENLIGRSQPFWAHWYGRLQAHFPSQLEGVSVGAFHRAVNRVAPSLIRVEADEITYNLHIMLRTELELGLMDGSLLVRDLPEAWNAKMQDYLGITPPSDSLGVLQDIHWSSGYIGSFPTYTLGNIMSCQFFEAARQQQPDLELRLASGDYAPLRGWLTQNIYRHGRRFTPDELLRRSTGRPLEVRPYLEYLEQKFIALYGLERSSA